MAFNIDIEFLGGLTPSQQSIFQQAAARWSEIIVGDLPSFTIQGVTIDDLLIFAQGVAIDGPSMVLGQAGPRFFREDSGLPAVGLMEFDTADVAGLEANGGLLNTIIHEMGHVLGIGTLWENLGLLQGAGTFNPVFVGENAAREFGALIGNDGPLPVPVENRGGPGTADGHFRELLFANELMTGFLDPGFNPISRVTVGALEDMGYEVNYDAADAYQLPSCREMTLMGLHADQGVPRCRACGLRRGVKPLPLPG
jgi:hypothetical protein